MFRCLLCSLCCVLLFVYTSVLGGILYVLFVNHPSDHSLLRFAVSVRALDVTVSQSSVQVARGQAAILPCSFSTSAALTNLNIIWMVIPLSNANQPEQVHITYTHSLTVTELCLCFYSRKKQSW